MRKKNPFLTVLYGLFLILGGVVMIYPLLWLVSSSFKPSNEVFSTSTRLIPLHPTLMNYSNGWRGFTKYTFGTFFKNSAFIAVTGTVLSVMSSSVVAYGFSRFRGFVGRKILFSCMLISMMLPFQIIMIPQFIWFKKLNLIGSFLPLILPYCFGEGFLIFLIMQFISGIPMELDESAKIDGCSYLRIFIHIIVPLAVPALVTSTIFSFLNKWSDYMAPLIYSSGMRNYTVSIALKLFCDPTSSSDYGAMFAMSTLSIVPLLVIFISMQKYLVEGISTTGLKG